ncbi:CHASE3 domain-containing protein [Vibrio algicola]|uniref:CHASE3 domain-containing protein n=1 Tax=Vibrio algicola TaxID=2662262 RepID=UPI0015B555B2|nr:hypothetical protein [Vibrio algicola]
MRKYQGGFASLISLLVVLSVIGYLAIFYVKHEQQDNIKNNQNSFYNHVTNIITQINAYQSDQYDAGILPDSQDLFPDSLATLQTKGYLGLCSTADNQNGNCMRPEQTPWGDDIDYTRQKMVGQKYYEAILTIQLPPQDNSNAFEEQVSLNLFSQIAGTHYDEKKRIITITVTRLENLFALTTVVKRSGEDSTLTGNWDVGGDYSVTNAKDFRIRNANGTQRSLAVGVVDSFSAESPSNIQHPQCAPGLTPDIVATPKFVSLPDGIYEHTPAGAVINNNATYWSVSLKYMYKNTSGNWAQRTEGTLTIQTVCH